MFAYIKGTLAEATPTHAIVEANGIGYRILLPPHTFSQLPQIGEETRLHTAFVVRETSQDLYGFTTTHERILFEFLTAVSGIGPKLALALIGHLPSGELQQAVINHNIAALSKVPGVGKKTAERLIVELRDKIAQTLPAQGDSTRSARPGSDPQSQKWYDAMSALINLGYKQDSAREALKKAENDLGKDPDLSTFITYALKHV